MSLENLKQRISAFYNEKQASEGVSAGSVIPDTEAINIKDPQESPTPQGGEPLKHDGDDASKQALPPASLTTTNDQKGKNNIPGGQSGEASGKAPNGAGEGGHSAKGGDSKDEAVSSPTDASVAKTSSVAAKAQNLAAAIRSDLFGQKEATEVVAEEAVVEVAEESKEATEELAGDFETEENAYHKIAELVLNYEEGRQMVNDLADREFGKEAAAQLIDEAQYVQSIQNEVAMSEAQGAQAADELLKSASEEDVQEMQKLAAVHGMNVNKMEYDFEHEAYDLGCKQAAMAMDAGGEIPGGGGDVSLDEVAAVIMQMVESGELDPQTAEAVLQQLAGADAGGGDPMAGGMPPGMEGGDPMAGGEIPPELMEQAMGKGAAEELQKAAAFVRQQFEVDESEKLKEENEALKKQLAGTQGS